MTLTALSAEPRPLQAFAAYYEALSVDEAMVRACLQVRENANELAPPFGLASILKVLGARKMERQMDCLGKLEVDDGGYVVVVQSHQNWRRSRFTVAHEIGHILILNALVGDTKMLRSLQDPIHWNRVERLCDFAASELLLPCDDVQSAIRNLKTTHVIKYLYDRYMCSRAALLHRLTALHPGLVGLVWKFHARHPAEKQTWRVSWCSSRKYWWPGMTARRISPDVLSHVAQSGTPSIATLSFMQGRRSSQCVAFTEPLARNERPLFAEFPIPDEFEGDSQIGMLFAKSQSLQSNDSTRSLFEILQGTV